MPPQLGATHMAYSGPKVSGVPAIPGHEDERWRALHLMSSREFRPVQDALARGCYPEIIAALRSSEYDDVRGRVIRSFFGDYTGGDAIAQYIEGLSAQSGASTATRYEFEMAFPSAANRAGIDWLAIATGPRERDRALLREVRRQQRSLGYEITTGVMAALLDRTMGAIVRGSSAEVGWPCQRLALELLKTCQMGGAEAVLNLENEERDNRSVIKGWFDGEVLLWPSARKALPFQ